MSVYTTIEEQELSRFLESYAAGTLQGYEGIVAGIENTNYFVTTTTGEYVLTLFEQLGWDDLPYFLDIMAFLAEHQVPSAHPIADHQGAYLRQLCGKPAALVERLQGQSVDHPTPSQCGAIGRALGQMHALADQFHGERVNPRGYAWCQSSVEQLQGRLDDHQAELLQQELQAQRELRREQLPQGVIHADLFRDNALFVGDRLTGIIDFYYACNDALLYDLAVTVNDWCNNGDGSIHPQRYQALLLAYRQQRPFTPLEQESWPLILRAAALRFWLSRLVDLHFPRPGEITQTKDPKAYQAILQWHCDHPLRLDLSD